MITNDTEQTKEHKIIPQNSPQITTNRGLNGDLSRIHYLEQERRGYKVLIHQNSQPTTSLATQDEAPQYYNSNKNKRVTLTTQEAETKTRYKIGS